MKVLHVAAEIFPLVKTGGLADVVAALPLALARDGVDVRLALPGYPAVMDGVHQVRKLLDIGPCFGALRVRLLLARLPVTDLQVYVVDAPYLFNRRGGPYQDVDGKEWPDNAQRFALLGWLAAHLAGGDADPHWQPQVVHAHDWHAAMACAYMAERGAGAAASVFTVHNLAFQGLFPISDAPLLALPSRLMSQAGLEYHGQMSFMKAGLKFADRITTVSPSYAREITTHAFGCGLDGVLRARAGQLSGILNGIDEEQWNPATDPAIAARYDAERLQGKRECRRALQSELGLDVDEDVLLLTIVSRITAQKGLDLMLAALPALVHSGVQFAIQGQGDAALEASLLLAQATHPGRVRVVVGYDEARAHRLIAGADVIAVPSRFEPCGLTQMYGLRYGTLPIVRRVGGLADTVVDASPAALQGGTATGFVFDAATPAALQRGVEAALALRRQGTAWSRMMATAMARRLSWAGPAKDYQALYAAAAAGKALP